MDKYRETCERDLAVQNGGAQQGAGNRPVLCRDYLGPRARFTEFGKGKTEKYGDTFYTAELVSVERRRNHQLLEKCPTSKPKCQ